MGRLLIILIFLVLHAGAFAQSPAEKFVKWSVGNPSIRPFVFFNQPKYAPGDTAWFKAYLFESDTLLKRAVILSLAVINKKAQQVALVNIRIQQGQAHNQIVLPDTLSPGLYHAVAFTEFMINNPSSVAFQRDIEVVKKQTVRSSGVTMSFAAEGGTLVSGITNKVIVRTTTVDDSGLCELVDASGNVVTTFRIRSGLGYFHFKPDGRPYSVRSNGKTFALPPAKDDGIGILLTPGVGTASTRVILTTPAGSPYREDNLYVMLSINGNVHYSTPLNLGDKEFTQFAIPKASLPSGIAKLSVFSSKTELLAERDFYVENYQEVVARLTPIQKTVIQRDKVEVEVSLTDISGNPIQGEFAVTAINQNLFPEDNLAGPFAFPGGHPGAASWTGNDRRDIMDLQLAANPPSAELWKEAFGATKVVRPAGILLHFKGRAFDRTTQAAVPDFTRIALYLQNAAVPFECMVFDGAFELHTLTDFTGIDEFFYEAEFKGKPLSNVGIRWENVTQAFVPASPSVQQGDIDAYADFVAKARVINQSYSFYDKDQKVQTPQADPNEVLEDEAGGADVVVTLDKFIAFPNMDEVIREIIPALTHRKQGKGYAVRVFLYGAEHDSKADPIYVIDGLMTRDTDYFMNLKPSNIITIKVIRDFNKLITMGPLGANGIVFVRTKTPDPAGVRAGSRFISAQGVSKQLTFKAGDHSQDFDSRAPDFRSTFYWNPSIKTDKAGKAMISFYASDDIGPITISIIGLTTQGRPFSGSAKANIIYAGGNDK